MDHLWLYSLSHCIVSVCITAASVRMCIVISSKDRVTDIQGRRKGDWTRVGSVSRCLRLCLGWVGAVGGAAGVPVTIVLNMRSSRCLYTCITLVCCPLMARHFSMFLLILLTVDTHLQLRLGLRWVHSLHYSCGNALFLHLNAIVIFLLEVHHESHMCYKVFITYGYLTTSHFRVIWTIFHTHFLCTWSLNVLISSLQAISENME